VDKIETMKVIKKFIKALKMRGINIDKVILYGSYIKGNVRPDSDIDVAIVSKDFGQDRVEEGMMLFRIAGTIDSRLEPVPISTEAYKKDLWNPLIYEIRKRGQIIKNLG
jgi:predicted nucleotidyltransferase